MNVDPRSTGKPGAEAVGASLAEWCRGLAAIHRARSEGEGGDGWR